MELDTSGPAGDAAGEGEAVEGGGEGAAGAEAAVQRTFKDVRFPSQRVFAAAHVCVHPDFVLLCCVHA